MEEKRPSLDVNQAEHLEHFDVNHNKNARIKNPLAHLSDQVITQDVQNFAESRGKTHLAQVLTKGALIASDPAAFAQVPGITEDEKLALRNEVLHKWRQTKDFYFRRGSHSRGAWDQAGSNDANLSFPEALGIPVDAVLPDSRPNPDANLNQWIQGLINAAPYMFSAVVACWLSDSLHNYFDRRGAIFISAISCVLPPFGSEFSQTWEQLLITRFLLGVGMGVKLATMSVYCAECAPAIIRGGLATAWLIWTCFGIFLGACANLVVKDVRNIAWRLQFGSAFIPAAPFMIGVYFCPEGPHWYIKKGEFLEAYKSFVRLRNTETQAARDLYYAFAQMRFERTLEGQGSYVARIFQLFTIPRVRRATLASFVVMIAQQVCGVNVVAFYSATIFVEAGSTVTEALAATCGFALIVLVFGFVAVFTIDTFGRRALLLTTFPAMFVTLLAAGFSFYIPSSSPAQLGMIATFIYIFTAFYVAGEGAIPYVYSSEVFPLSYREMGMALVVAIATFWATVLSLTFPRMFVALCPQGTFGFYGGCNLVALLMIFLLVSETKGRILEEIDYIFGVSTRTFMSHQVLKVLPWAFRDISSARRMWSAWHSPLTAMPATMALSSKLLDNKEAHREGLGCDWRIPGRYGQFKVKREPQSFASVVVTSDRSSGVKTFWPVPL